MIDARLWDSLTTGRLSKATVRDDGLKAQAVVVEA